MSVDDRLRTGLSEFASRLPEPDVEMRFHRSLAAHRRRAGIRGSAAAAALVAACALVGLALIAPDRPGLLWPAVDPPPSLDLRGSYTGLAPRLPDVPDSAGQWRIDIADDGQVTATPPTGAARDPLRVGTMTADRLTTDLFTEAACGDTAPGTYTAERALDRVTLRLDKDRCAPRVQLLTTTDWVSTRTTSWDGPTIPDGRWTRDVDVAELRQRGLDPTPEVLRANFLDDGHGRFHLEVTGTRFFVFVEDDDGSLVLGDEGDLSYDAFGRLVQNLDLAVEWTVDDGVLVTRNVSPVLGVRLAEASPDERLALEGTWRRGG